jgi:protein-tyrosine kinase
MNMTPTGQLAKEGSPVTYVEGEDIAGVIEAPARDIQFHVAESVTVLSDRVSARAESVGALRTHILSQHIQQGRRSLALCSTQAGVGCTTLAVNLAVALSQVEVKTLLIDGDLRNPSVHRHVAPSREVVGLLQYLEHDKMALGDAIQFDVLPNLSVLYAGGAAEKPQELLARARFSELFDSCMRDFDITIIDSPPSNSSADSRRISSVAGYAMIVVANNRTYVHDVEVLTEELRSDGTTIIGTVLIDE